MREVFQVANAVNITKNKNKNSVQSSPGFSEGRLKHIVAKHVLALVS